MIVSIPDRFKCPVTLEIMRDGVCVCAFVCVHPRARARACRSTYAHFAVHIGSFHCGEPCKQIKRLYEVVYWAMRAPVLIHAHMHSRLLTPFEPNDKEFLDMTGSGNVSELCSMFIKVYFSCTGLSEFSRQVIESPSFVTSVMVFSAVHNSRKRYQWGDVANKEKQEKNKAQPRVVQL